MIHSIWVPFHQPGRYYHDNGISFKNTLYWLLSFTAGWRRIIFHLISSQARNDHPFTMKSSKCYDSCIGNDTTVSAQCADPLLPNICSGPWEGLGVGGLGVQSVSSCGYKVNHLYSSSVWKAVLLIWYVLLMAASERFYLLPVLMQMPGLLIRMDSTAAL